MHGCLVIPAQGELSQFNSLCCSLAAPGFSLLLLLQHPWSLFSLFPCPLLQSLNSDSITALEDAPVPKSQKSSAPTGVFFSPVTTLFQPEALDTLWGLSSQFRSSCLGLPPLAGLPRILMCWYLFLCPLPSPSLLLFILHSALPKIPVSGSQSVLTPPVSPGFSNFPVKDLGSCTKLGRGGFALSQNTLFLQRLFMCQKPLLINLYRSAGTLLCLQQKKDCQRHEVGIIHISQPGSCVLG